MAFWNKEDPILTERLVVAHERMADALEELVEITKKEQMEKAREQRFSKRSWSR